MVGNQTFITQTGYKKLVDELENLKRIKRKEISERIQEAQELGDLSENAEYVEAKNEQAFTEGRIQEIEALLKHAIIIKEKKEPRAKSKLVQKLQSRMTRKIKNM